MAGAVIEHLPVDLVGQNRHVGVRQQPLDQAVHLLARSNPGLRIEEETGFLHYTVPMNTTVAPFDNNDVRLAMKYAIDRDEYLQKILKGYGVLGNDSPIGTEEMDTLLISNLEVVPGRRVVEHLGLVQGSTVRAKHVGRDIAAGLKNLVGGELKGYTELLMEARGEAVTRMQQQAIALGANAVINIRFSTSSVTSGASELYAYGTAVKVS